MSRYFSRLGDARLSRRGAFSLIELIIVIVIIGILAAIAVPRLSRGAASASENALAANLAALRGALELFHAEHNQTYPSLANLPGALTSYSDQAGAKFGDRDPAEGVIYGPYLRALPALPVGANKGKTAVVASLGGDGGWVYDAAKGTIKANAADGEVDGAGKKYNEY